MLFEDGVAKIYSEYSGKKVWEEGGKIVRGFMWKKIFEGEVAK